MTGRLVWDKGYEIGHEFIDSQHRMLVDLIGMTSAAISANAPRARMLRVFQQLKKFAEFHFVSEECYMLDTEYAGYAEHQKAHSHLLSELSAHIANFNRDKSDARDVLAFLNRWLTVHLTEDDRRIAPGRPP